jgi:hypothetical protein
MSDRRAKGKALRAFGQYLPSGYNLAYFKNQVHPKQSQEKQCPKSLTSNTHQTPTP